MKYGVKKETYDNKLIEDLGQMTIKDIEKLAYEYIGDVFKDKEGVERNMKYIEENGEELWLCDDDIQISIELIIN